jgi:hypothetical protein
MQEASLECWHMSTTLDGCTFQKIPNPGTLFKMIFVAECMFNVRRGVLLCDYTQKKLVKVLFVTEAV